MWIAYCVLCIFTFPEPSISDRAQISRLIPSFGLPSTEDSSRIWGELDGPYFSSHILLLTPAFGIVRQIMSWRAGSITMQAPGAMTFVVEKRHAAWRLIASSALILCPWEPWPWAGDQM
jgi:hypothetical protein